MTDQLEFRIPAARSRAIDTSMEAAQRVSVRLSDAHRHILALLKDRGDLTPDEAAHLMGWPVLFSRPRFSELYRAGEIERSVKRKSSLGHSQWAWRLRAA